MERQDMPQISPEPRIAMLKKLCIAAVFAIAFAYIEAAVVVYLREIFYPAGFTFPLASFPDTSLGKRILLTEIGREVATIVVIFSISWLFTKGFMNRLACFIDGLGHTLSDTCCLGRPCFSSGSCLNRNNLLFCRVFFILAIQQTCSDKPFGAARLIGGRDCDSCLILHWGPAYH